jgi:hypothetical protein
MREHYDFSKGKRGPVYITDFYGDRISRKRIDWMHHVLSQLGHLAAALGTYFAWQVHPSLGAACVGAWIAREFYQLLPKGSNWGSTGFDVPALRAVPRIVRLFIDPVIDNVVFFAALAWML